MLMTLAKKNNMTLNQSTIPDNVSPLNERGLIVFLNHSILSLVLFDTGAIGLACNNVLFGVKVHIDPLC